MIRKIEARDRETYLAMAREFYTSGAALHPVPERHLTDTFEELMRGQEYASCYLAEVADVAAGYALTAKTYSQEAGGIVVWVEELFVRPAFRGAGLGSALLKRIESDLPAARYRLEIEPDNRRACALYTALGYRELPYGQMIKQEEK